jgi:hypothetical protein
MQTSYAADAPMLMLNATVAEHALHLKYTLTNRTPNTVVAFDGATGIGGGDFPDLTGQCYVSYIDGIARILRIRPGPHPTMDTTRILMPSASVLAPGEERRVQFRLAIPVKECAEYSPDYSGAKYAKHAVDGLELRIGYFFKTPETVVQAMGAPGVFKVVKAAPLSQTYQVSQSCPITFEMLVRTEPDFLRM